MILAIIVCAIARIATAYATFLPAIVVTLFLKTIKPLIPVALARLGAVKEAGGAAVITHRTNDYHPDHRYVGVLVQDAAFMVTVPFFCPDIPFMKKNPVFMYSSDGFQKPYPFTPSIAVAISEEEMAQKIDGLHELTSQAYEGGASGSAEHVEKNVPSADNEPARRAWLQRRWHLRQSGEANRYRAEVIKWYGDTRGQAVKFAETFELCEYGRRPSESELKDLFPFFD